MSDTDIKWPEKKTFAFTVFDDCDNQYLENGRVIYDFLYDVGILTTKSVWPLNGYKHPYGRTDDKYRSWVGDTCANTEHLKWVLDLFSKGFDIGIHNMTFHTSSRNETIQGFNTFKKYFGHYPNIHANHCDCSEGIYWGANRLSGFNKLIYKMLTFRRNSSSLSHLPESDLFWGDICRKHIKYVRNFVYRDINTLNKCPFMPYHDPLKPFVNYWFASSNAPDVSSFNKILSPMNQDKLESEGGLCILYTHFGKGFVDQGKLNKETKELIVEKQ